MLNGMYRSATDPAVYKFQGYTGPDTPKFKIMRRVLQSLGFLGMVASIVMPDHARYGKLYSLVQSDTDEPNKTMDQLWFTQEVDHFQIGSTKTFQQRYYVDDTHWNDKRNPILLYIGGESALNQLPGGFVTELAARHGAKVVALEHRFYGKSVPNGNDFSVENLKYLSVEQALADLALFRQVYQQMLPYQQNAWIAIGGSYPGALSAWFR